MRPIYLATLAFFLGAFSLFTSCTDPTTLGSELFEEDQVGVGRDTFNLTGTTIPGDTVRTYSLGQELATYMFGDFNDPVFGRSIASIFMQVRPTLVDVDFENMVFDSVVLVLPYDSIGFYGVTDEEYEIDVFRVLEDIEVSLERSYFSDQTFMTENKSISDETFRYTPSLDSVRNIKRYNGSSNIDNVDLDTIDSYPQLRLHLETAVAEELADQNMTEGDTLFTNDALFIDFFKGLHVKSKNTLNGLISFALDNLNTDYLPGLRLYYRDIRADSTQFEFIIPFSPFSARIVNFEHDYSGAFVDSFVDSTETAKETTEFLFAQGLEGLDVKLEIPGITDLKDQVIVNRADLFLNIVDLDIDDLSVYTLPEQLILSRLDEEGNIVVIDDILISPGTFSETFGGTPFLGDDDTPSRYRMNISTVIQRMIDGDISNELILSVFPKNERGPRVVIHGPNANDPTLRPILDYSFTELNN